jgi:hypothetical protein
MYTAKIPLLPHACYMPCPSDPPCLDHSNDIWRIVQVMELLISFCVTSWESFFNSNPEISVLQRCITVLHIHIFSYRYYSACFSKAFATNLSSDVSDRRTNRKRPRGCIFQLLHAFYALCISILFLKKMTVTPSGRRQSYRVHLRNNGVYWTLLEFACFQAPPPPLHIFPHHILKTLKHIGYCLHLL